MRPPTTVGWPLAMGVFAYAKAHFSFSLGTWAAARPAFSADWKRVLARSAPQPFQLFEAASRGFASEHMPVTAACWAPIILPVRNSATVFFCAAASGAP